MCLWEHQPETALAGARVELRLDLPTLQQWLLERQDLTQRMVPNQHRSQTLKKMTRFPRTRLGATLSWKLALAQSHPRQGLHRHSGHSCGRLVDRVSSHVDEKV